jgi:hypothetical protein
VPDPLVCRRCGAPFEAGQEYCLECGNRLVAARRAPGLAAWVVPSAVALLVAAAGTAAAIAARGQPKGNTRPASVAVSPLRAAPAPPVVKLPAGPKKPSGQKLMAWPSTNGYTIVLASLPLSQGGNAARARANAALRDGLDHVGVLVSSSYASLQPGYYVVFSGVYPSLAEAQSDLASAKEHFPAAYARPIVR